MVAQIYDPEVKTPAHDAIMLWLNENITGIIQNLHPEVAGRNWGGEYLGKIISTAIHESGKTECAGPLDDPPPFGIVLIDRVTWEYPVVKGEGQYQRIMGFVDLAVEYTIPTRLSAWISKKDDNLHWEIEARELKAFFEVKSSIGSLGEVIRQINLYRQLLGSHHEWFLVCPDNSHADLIESQRILFIQCPKPGATP